MFERSDHKIIGRRYAPQNYIYNWYLECWKRLDTNLITRRKEPLNANKKDKRNKKILQANGLKRDA